MKICNSNFRNKKIFQNIAISHRPSWKEFSRCPDQYVGHVSVTNNTTSNPPSSSSGDDFLTRKNIACFSQVSHPTIFLVLESPHKEEYKGHTPRPAAGRSISTAGGGIRELFSEVCPLQNYLPSGDFGLVIVNSVQYPCALGDIDKYRDDVFLECWHDFGEANFGSRIRKLYKPGDIIINACTKGKKRLRDLVDAALCANATTPHLRVFHPCNWSRTYNTANAQGITANYSWTPGP